ncbi:MULTISPECIES: MarR family winged helix-turn-helix transcriptional regulator [unclassified Streptomyces]|uniref:MarR family winged helix-turn-helix transcriptional regulator n=1 Tax=unclassified Streptomyces TaxID=2593676 RepID=UPI001C318048|nr:MULTISPECIES: MarR family transcriptional regulator [unclassified Streptomyces]
MTTHESPDPDGRAMGQELSLRVILFHEAVAAHLGLNATEHKILSLIAAEPGVSPGQLVERTGLSNPAITKIVHRLVSLGHVDRRKDGSDGRRYALRVTSTHRRDLARLFAPMAEAMNGLVDGMDDVERAAVTRWLTGTVEILRRSTAELTQRREADRPADRQAPPQ